MNELDLVEQYFLRDLTEDEKIALDELLERSPEAAGLFQERAGAVSPPRSLPEIQLPPPLPPPEAAGLFQERAGAVSPPRSLPELKLPPSLPPPKRGVIPLSLWLWVLAGYVLLAAAFWFWSRNHDIHWPWSLSEPVASSGPADSPAQEIPKTASRGLVSPLANEIVTDNDAALAMGVPPTPEDEPNDGVTPVPASALSPNSGNPGLRILVERPMPGLVTVTVLDSAGDEIRTLYNGTLQAGRWAIDWDGRLADGNKAPIGAYALLARSGSKDQKQEVWIGQ